MMVFLLCIELSQYLHVLLLEKWFISGALALMLIIRPTHSPSVCAFGSIINRSINASVLLREKLFKIQSTLVDVHARPMHEPKVSALDENQHQRKCTGFESFLEQQDVNACIDLIHTRQKNKIICSRLLKMLNKMA